MIRQSSTKTRSSKNFPLYGTCCIPHSSAAYVCTNVPIHGKCLQVVPPPSHVVQSGVDGRGIDVVPSKTLEQFVGVETDRLDHAFLGVELLLDLLKEGI